MNEPIYPLKGTTGLDQVKDEFAFILGQVVFDENDLYSGDHQNGQKLQKLSVKDVAVEDFNKDIGVLNDLKQKVNRNKEFSSQVLSGMIHDNILLGSFKIPLEDCLDPIKRFKQNCT